MPKSRSSRRNRKGRKLTPQAPVAPVQRAVAQPVPVAEPGVAPSVSAIKERPAGRPTRRDYSYVRRDLQRMAILAAGVLITIVVLSFFLP